jgi:hypothetical protein
LDVFVVLIHCNSAADGFARKGVIINGVFPGTLIEGSFSLVQAILIEDVDLASFHSEQERHPSHKCHQPLD